MDTIQNPEQNESQGPAKPLEWRGSPKTWTKQMPLGRHVASLLSSSKLSKNIALLVQHLPDVILKSQVLQGAQKNTWVTPRHANTSSESWSRRLHGS